MAKHGQATNEGIVNSVKSYYPDADLSILNRAYELAAHAHRAQISASGAPYIIHPLDVAQTLADLKLDIHSIVAGLLHDTVEDTDVTLDDIRDKFGDDITELVDGVTKLSKITFKTSEEKQAENFRKM